MKNLPEDKLKHEDKIKSSREYKIKPKPEDKIIGKGAEAVIYLKSLKQHGNDIADTLDMPNILDVVVKNRVQKNYRIPEIDTRFRRFRTRREAKILEKLQAINGIWSPELISTDDKDMLVTMGFIDGPKLRDVLEKLPYKQICRRIGKKIALMHNNGIIHSDLTTSNMILRKKDSRIYFIDFGLSFFSEKIEDRAVDLHLLRQALESKHYRIWEECFEAVLKGYKKECPDFEAIIKRLIIVENRGRYKHKTDYYTNLYCRLFKQVS